jgi:hypothetical protein
VIKVNPKPNCNNDFDKIAIVVPINPKELNSKMIFLLPNRSARNKNKT